MQYTSFLPDNTPSCAQKIQTNNSINLTSITSAYIKSCGMNDGQSGLLRKIIYFSKPVLMYFIIWCCYLKLTVKLETKSGNCEHSGLDQGKEAHLVLSSSKHYQA